MAPKTGKSISHRHLDSRNQYTKTENKTTTADVPGHDHDLTELLAYIADNYVAKAPPVVQPPVASFTTAPVGGTAPLTVTFTDTSVPAATGWSWDFGDSTPVVVGVKTTTHVYAAGDFSAKLTATNAGGSSTAVKSISVTPIVIPPATLATISNVDVVATGNTIVAQWDVAPASQGQVEWGTTSAYGNLTPRETSYTYTHHRQEFTAPSGTIHLRIRASAPGQTVDTLSPDKTVDVGTVVIPIPPVTPPPGTAPADTVMFPVAGSTQSDMRAQIQAFIEQQRTAGKTAGFDAVYRWDSRMVLNGSGIKIWLGPNAQFRRTVAGGVRSMLSPFKTDGLILTGSNALHFVGPASTAQVSQKNDAYPNEDEYCFEIYGGTGLTISNIKLFGFWSDGFYVYRADDNVTGTHTRNLTLRDIDSSSMGRNSITVNSCEGLLMERFSGTVARLHGFDYEPNRPDDLLKDATIKDCGFFGFDAGLTASGRGYAVAIGHKDAGGKATNVKVINQRQDAAVKGGTLYLEGPSGRHDGVTVTGWNGVSGSGYVAHVNNWQQSGNSISLPASGTVG